LLSNGDKKFIHLLYAPTNFCNMACTYCYLGDGTNEITNTDAALNTLRRAIELFRTENIIPFNLSFHGGEPTAIPKNLLADLLAFSSAYYEENKVLIKEAGFPLNPVHIKTNLYNFDHLFDLFSQYQVSISASVDLPLSLHGHFRFDKRGKSTLEKIKHNLSLLARYPYHKKISCVVTQSHFEKLDEFIADIKLIHFDIGLDMTKFNIMFSFDSQKNGGNCDKTITSTKMLTQTQQVEIYQALRKEFNGTELEPGLNTHWFKEFTPEFCCSSVNCGDKFFLLQSNGDVFSCPRGQSSKNYLYGNIFKQKIPEIINNGWQTIETIENRLDADDNCFSCEYLPYCNQGCVFVREQVGLKKSYTCQLQKQLYKDQPSNYPAFSSEYIQDYAKKYRLRNNLKSFMKDDLKVSKRQVITPELFLDKNSLASLIENDDSLKHVYSDQLITLHIDGVSYPLASAILSNKNEMAVISKSSTVILSVPEWLFSIEAKDDINNHVTIMLLRNTMVVYGDEGREKQEHLADYSVYKNSFENLAQKRNNQLQFDLAPFLIQHCALFAPGVRNNLYITTKTLREYHYQKQRKNAFYHLQAINLPFPFLEFYWWA